MKDGLAERLLANVMGWSPADVVRERPILQTFAMLKYDEYQQFSPGMRFVESLALWLNQFDPNERRVAYEFVRSRLIFLSESEMAHFAAVMYPDFIRPLLIEKAAEVDRVPPYRVGKVAAGVSFKNLQRSMLFFGLSDGARIDQFRRSNRELSHEQIFPSFELPAERINKLKKSLANGGQKPPTAPAVVLLDDFAASGTSYVREENGQLDGKIVNFLKRVSTSPEWKELVVFPGTTVIVALYVATAQALTHMTGFADKLEANFGAKMLILPVQLLDKRIKVSSTSDIPFVKLIDRYYDSSEEDEHTRKGGPHVKYGFASCGLPLILHHNTPNNSLFLLWVERSEKIRPLFPRFSRHRRES